MQKIICCYLVWNKDMQKMPRADQNKARQCREAQKRQQILADPAA